MRKEIRAELESKLRQELGQDPRLEALTSKRNMIVLVSVLGVLAMFGLVAAGYLAEFFIVILEQTELLIPFTETGLILLIP